MDAAAGTPRLTVSPQRNKPSIGNERPIRTPRRWNYPSTLRNSNWLPWAFLLMPSRHAKHEGGTGRDREGTSELYTLTDASFLSPFLSSSPWFSSEHRVRYSHEKKMVVGFDKWNRSESSKKSIYLGTFYEREVDTSNWSSVVLSDFSFELSSILSFLTNESYSSLSWNSYLCKLEIFTLSVAVCASLSRKWRSIPQPLRLFHSARGPNWSSRCVNVWH